MAYRPDPRLRLELVRLLPDLRRRAERFPLGPAAREDLVQDTIERALRFEGRYEAGTNLRAWCLQILFHVFISRYRKTRREQRALSRFGADPSAWMAANRFLHPEHACSLSASTERHLGALPDLYAELIRMVDLGDKSYREAADALGVPVGTVMSRLHRGRRLLASAMIERTAQAA